MKRFILFIIVVVSLSGCVPENPAYSEGGGTAFSLELPDDLGAGEESVVSVDYETGTIPGYTQIHFTYFTVRGELRTVLYQCDRDGLCTQRTFAYFED